MLKISSYIWLWLLQMFGVLFLLLICKSYLHKRLVKKSIQKMILTSLCGISIIICMSFPVTIVKHFIFDLLFIPLIIAVIIGEFMIIQNRNSKKIIREERHLILNHLVYSITQQMLLPLQSAKEMIVSFQSEQLTEKQTRDLFNLKSNLQYSIKFLNQYLGLLDEEKGVQGDWNFVKELGEIIGFMRVYANLKQIPLNYISTAEKDISIKGEHSMIQFALMNMIKNAIDACESEGSVSISLHEMLKDVYIVIEYNNSTGDALEVLTKASKRPFLDMKESLGESGLAFTFKIAEIFGGRVEVKAMPNEGTTFSVYLPKWAL